MFSWSGVLIDRGSAVWWGASVFVLGSEAFVGLALAEASSMARTAVAGLIALVVVSFALPQLSMFAHAFVRSAAPGQAARAMVWVAVIGGSASAILSIRGVIDLFERPSLDHVVSLEREMSRRR
jgi:hypothetical protein